MNVSSIYVRCKLCVAREQWMWMVNHHWYNFSRSLHECVNEWYIIRYARVCVCVHMVNSLVTNASYFCFSFKKALLFFGIEERNQLKFWLIDRRLMRWLFIDIIKPNCYFSCWRKLFFGIVFRELTIYAIGTVIGLCVYIVVVH